MGIKDSNPEFWYQKADGSWGHLDEITSVSIDFSADSTDEVVAALSRILVPLGDLEIVPREK